MLLGTSLITFLGAFFTLFFLIEKSYKISAGVALLTIMFAILCRFAVNNFREGVGEIFPSRPDESTTPAKYLVWGRMARNVGGGIWALLIGAGITFYTGNPYIMKFIVLTAGWCFYDAEQSAQELRPRRPVIAV